VATYTEQIQAIANAYAASGEAWPATTQQIALWAIQKKLWKPQRSTMVEQCAEELSRAMGEEYLRDAQGRQVRAKHAARVSRNGKQTWLWDDIRTASRDHMARAFQNRRQQVFGEVRQLKLDVDSFNDNRTPARPIQMIYDFTADLEEMALATRPYAEPVLEPV
jgi:hypothetical protein